MRRTSPLLLALALLAAGTPAARAQSLVLGLKAMDLVGDRDLARDRFDAEQADVNELLRKRREAAKLVVEVRTAEFFAGRGTLDVLQQAQEKLKAADALAAPAVSRPALETQWRAAWAVYRLNKEKYEAGRATAADYHAAEQRLRDVEVQLALTRPKKK